MTRATGILRRVALTALLSAALAQAEAPIERPRQWYEPKPTGATAKRAKVKAARKQRRKQP